IHGSLQLSLSGAVSPGTGTTPGQLAVTGNYSQMLSTRLDLKVAGRNTPGTDYDQLVVGGTAILGGTISVSAVNGFTPVAGDSYHILTFVSHTSDFGSRSGFVFSNVFLVESFGSFGLDLNVFPTTI